MTSLLRPHSHQSQIAWEEVFKKAEEGAVKSSGDQVGFLRTTGLGSKAGMQHLMALLVPSVLYPRVPHGVQ